MTLMIAARPSPNHGPRPADAVIDMVILHYTGMPTAAEALDRLCSAEAGVSAHYLVEETGEIWRLVAEEQRAWHAGLSFWAGRRDINDCSIGIELVNPGHDWGYRPFPEAQMAALEELCRGILARHPIPARHVLGHSDVAPRRKQDPGELFDWPRLARAGIGLWPDFAAAPPGTADLAALQRRLGMIGYEIPDPGANDDDAVRAAIAAFQRHFRPGRCDGVADAETCGRAAAVAAACATP